MAVLALALFVAFEFQTEVTASARTTRLALKKAFKIAVVKAVGAELARKVKRPEAFVKKYRIVSKKRKRGRIAVTIKCVVDVDALYKTLGVIGGEKIPLFLVKVSWKLPEKAKNKLKEEVERGLSEIGLEKAPSDDIADVKVEISGKHWSFKVTDDALSFALSSKVNVSVHVFDKKVTEFLISFVEAGFEDVELTLAQEVGMVIASKLTKTIETKIYRLKFVAMSPSELVKFLKLCDAPFITPRLKKISKDGAEMDIAVKSEEILKKVLKMYGLEIVRFGKGEIMVKIHEG